VEFRLLGPVELWAHGEQIPLPSTKVKQLLAALLWTPGEIVSKFTLVARLWDEEAPPREMASLHANFSRLRRCLDQCGDPALKIEHVHLGYRLTAPAECIDVYQFKRSVAMANAAADQGGLDEAVRLLRSAESLVHGEVLAGLPGSWASGRRSVLEEEIHAATLRRIELLLAAHPDGARNLLPELHGLTAKNEFDEPALELRLKAMQLAGRASEALRVYGVYRERLRESSGLSPGPSLQTLYARLLQTEPARSGTAAATPTSASGARRPVVESPDTLERDPVGFVGRRKDVKSITAEIDGQLASGASAICVIDGMPAIGKSSLALHLAHRLRERCPDGAIQLHLRGHDETLRPTDTESALDVLLRMLGVDPGRIQHTSGLDHSIALWRRHTAGKRLLLFLDDAAEGEQVLPLIPNGAGSIVLVTARNRLTGLPGAIHHALPPMVENEAEELFIRSAKMSRTTDPALRDVLAACGGFPMALCVAGTALHYRSSWNIADLADDLASTRGTQQLDSIIAPAVYRSVSTSYRDLPDLERRLLRRLSLNPGSRIHLSAATVLADTSPFETHTALCNLVDQNLVIESSRRYYELHDMIRLFAAHACETEEDPEDVERTSDRLTRYILSAANTAATLFHPHRHVFLGSSREPADHGFGLSNAREATIWLAEEQGWLRTVAEQWFANGRPEEAGALVHMIHRFLDRRNLWKESVALHSLALQAWQELDNQAGEAHALIDLASAQWRLGAFEAALASAGEAMRMWSSLGDTAGQADALLQIGRVHFSRRNHTEAVAGFEECVALHLRHRDRHGQAVALHHLGVALFESGRHQAGIERTLQALDISLEISEESIESYCINNLGEFYARVGDYASAEPYYEQALFKVQKHNERHSTAVVALNLGDCHTRLHRPEAALPLLDRALDLFQRDGNEHGEMLVLIAQARAHHGLHRSGSARELLDRAIVTAQRSEDSRQIASICLINGDIYTDTGDVDAAALAYGQALRYARKADATLLHAIACHRLGDGAERFGDLSAAHAYWLDAIRLYGEAYPDAVSMLWQRMTSEDEGAA